LPVRARRRRFGSFHELEEPDDFQARLRLPVLIRLSTPAAEHGEAR
jgi:hypothetical protein